MQLHPRNSVGLKETKPGKLVERYVVTFPQKFSAEPLRPENIVRLQFFERAHERDHTPPATFVSLLMSIHGYHYQCFQLWFSEA